MGDTLLIRNALRVATFDDAGQEFEHADVLVEGNTVSAVGPRLASPPDARVIDATGMVCLPGFVNTHHHLPQVLTRAVPRMQDAELFAWLVNHYKVWRGFDAEGVYAAALAGLGELLLTGCTLSSDHLYLFPRAASGELIDAEIRAARELGIRFHPTRGCMTCGESHGGLPPDDCCQEEDEILADCERVVGRYHDSAPDAMLKVGLAPCAPFTVEPSTMTALAEMARAKGVRLHTHMAETLDEERYCAERFGVRPLEWARQMNWVGPDVWFAHVVHANAEEIAMLARTGTGVAHCPASNMRLGSGVAPITEMLRAGVSVSLGVDGSASNDSGDMWGEARQAMLLQRVANGAAAVGARDILRCATRNGARNLGFDRAGRIEPGALADIILIDIDRIGFAGAQHDPIGAILFAGDSHIVDYTIVNGRVVVERGRLVTVPEERICELTNGASRRLVESACQREGIDFLKRTPSATPAG